MFSDTVSSVIKIQENRSKRDEAVKQKILTMINDKIINYTKYNYTNCIFNIPNFIIGYLPYNIDYMCNFLIKQLSKEGLYIIKLNSENIYISWNINDLHKQTPINKTKKETSNLLNFANKNKLI
jgi:hypothetical protein